jgi:catechol 2,3-dioxygenase-like lactoylglutathione lyase family enzyme
MSTPISNEHTTQPQSPGPVEMKLEVVTIPVSDIDRAKGFYMGLGWRLDIDFTDGEFRGVQLTAPGSPCSIHLGKGGPAAPGSAQGLFLIVDDMQAARDNLTSHGAKVSETFHFEPGHRPAPGADPTGRSYWTYATFADPDGNTWLLQEVKTRLPGRGFSPDVATLTELLRETEEQHGHYEPTAPKHHWSGWYAAYVIARERGRTPDEAFKDATLNIEGTVVAQA